MMGRSGAAVPGELQQAASVMATLDLISDSARLKEAVKSVVDATAAYQEAEIEANAAQAAAGKTLAEAQAKLDALATARKELSDREAAIKAREDAVKAGEAALAERQAKLRAAME